MKKKKKNLPGAWGADTPRVPFVQFVRDVGLFQLVGGLVVSLEVETSVVWSDSKEDEPWKQHCLFIDDKSFSHLQELNLVNILFSLPANDDSTIDLDSASVCLA